MVGSIIRRRSVLIAFRRVPALFALGCLGVACGRSSRGPVDHGAASGGSPEGEGGAGDPTARAGVSGTAAGAAPSGGAGAFGGGGTSVRGGAGGTSGAGGLAPSPSGAGGEAQATAGESATGGADTIGSFVATECFPGFSAAAEGLSFDGRFAAALESDASGQTARLALIDRESGLPRFIQTASADIDPPSISGDALRLLYGAGAGNQGRAYVLDLASEQVLASYLVGDLVSGGLGFDGRFLGFSTRDQTITSPPPHVQGGAVVVDVETGAAILASVTPSGGSSTDYSSFVDVSDDGERVVFASPATDLAPGKTGHSWDVYLHSRDRAVTALVSRTPAGGFADAYSYRPRISGDGRVVAFESAASDIVAGDVADTPDVMILELETDVTSSPTVQARGENKFENLSRDGRFVLLSSTSPLVPADDNGTWDAFVYDRTLDETELASVDRTGATLAAGGNAVAISGDGKVVAFVTVAPELAGESAVAVLCFATRVRGQE